MYSAWQLVRGENLPSPQFLVCPNAIIKVSHLKLSWARLDNNDNDAAAVDYDYDDDDDDASHKEEELLSQQMCVSSFEQIATTWQPPLQSP